MSYPSIPQERTMSSECVMSGHHPSRVRLGANGAVGPDNEAGADSSPDSAPDPAPCPASCPHSPLTVVVSVGISLGFQSTSAGHLHGGAWGGLGWGGEELCLLYPSRSVSPARPPPPPSRSAVPFPQKQRVPPRCWTVCHACCAAVFLPLLLACAIKLYIQMRRMRRSLIGRLRSRFGSCGEFPGRCSQI